MSQKPRKTVGRKESTPTQSNAPPGFRVRAEAALPSRHRDVGAMPLEEIRQVVYELELHQIELEMQNDVLRAAEIQLAESRDRLSDLYDFAPVGYLTLDGDSTVVAANLAAATMLGVERECAMAEKFTRFIAPESQDAFYLLHRMAESGTGKQTGELLLRDVGDTSITVLMNMVCVTDSVTGVLSWHVAISDISDRKRKEKALHGAELAKSAAEGANQAKSQFLSNLSHEIRTPLNGILGMTELLLDTGLNAEQQGFAHIARRSGEALLGILNDVLDLSKIEAGKLEIEAVPFDVWQVARDVTAMYVERARGKRIDLLCQIDNNLPIHAIGDPVRLTQVLTNLISNAIKFTDSGEVSLRVQLAGTPHTEPATEWMIRFAVRDTGIGVNEAARARLFQPFSQGDSSITRKFGGTGLGLAIAKQLVEAMGGTIELDSTAGKGSLFQFTVRLGKCQPMSVQPAAPAIAEHQRNSGDRPGARVLLAEDNPINQLMASRLLHQLGYQVEVAHDGQEAVTRASAGDIDLILMDWQMPVMDGLEATARIRKQEALDRPGTRVPVIVVTANALRGDRERCIAAGIDDYLSKPFSRLQLQEMLARHLPHWTAEQTRVQ
ncbi:MAG: ATP-binding protein [Burkholderiales bacterium]